MLSVLGPSCAGSACCRSEAVAVISPSSKDRERPAVTPCELGLVVDAKHRKCGSSASSKRRKRRWRPGSARQHGSGRRDDRWGSLCFVVFPVLAGSALADIRWTELGPSCEQTPADTLQQPLIDNPALMSFLFIRSNRRRPWQPSLRAHFKNVTAIMTLNVKRPWWMKYS
jgi:hypothetical protein